MTTLQLPEQEQWESQRLRNEWTRDVERLEQELTAWAEQEGWQVRTSERIISEESIGTYAASDLIIETPRKERLLLEVKGRGPTAASGRVQLSAWPTLFRVLLLRKPGQNDWIIRTDSGIPIRQPWNRDTFISVANDLLNAEQ